MMTVEGFLVTDEMETELVAWMRKQRVFRCIELAGAARIISSCPWKIDRIADRMIQKHRKLGNIRMTDKRPNWEWIG